MEALCIQPGEVGGLASAMDEMEQAKSVEDLLSNSSSDEEDMEPQPPPVIRRKVSFADAFGLDLVSVKEFDNVGATNLDSTVPCETEEAISTEDFHMCRLFTVPPTPEELEEKVQVQMLELERIELLPKTTTLRGIVRVLNVCFNKLVYVRMTLDRWRSHFDLLAEYVPGSSDRKTDRFAFHYALVPPFDKEGTRLEFCLRYETSVGTFWANNNKMNYVLFCRHRVRDSGPQMQEESNKIKKSCLKANRRESAEEQLIQEVLNTATYATESKSTRSEASCQSNSTGAQSSLHGEENKHAVDSLIKSQHRAARLAHTQEPCPQRRQRVRPGCSHDLPQHQKGSQPISSACSNLSSFLHKSNKAQSSNSAQVLTYHQIPLAPLDWSNDKPQSSNVDGVDDMWTERAQITLSKSHEESSVTDTAVVTSVWETAVNKTEEAVSKESHVLDVCQDFINTSDCETLPGVSESEWLQTATPMSPLNNEDPPAQCEVSRHVRVGQDTPNLEAASSNACHLLSDTAETSLANVALNGDDQEAVAALAYVRSPGDDSAGTQDTPQRSETNSVRETAQEFSLVGAKPVSKGSVDSPSECREHEIWEREGAGIMGRIGGAEPFTMHRVDLVTSSGESQTTDMTAMPESPNASAVDTISQGAGLQQGLSYSRDGKVTATPYNTMDDTLAFKETMRQGTADGERFVFSAHRRGAEEGLTTKCAGNKVSKKEEIVRPREIEKCHVSRGGGGGGEPQRDFGLEYDSLEQCEQNETDASSLDELCSVENSEEYFHNLRKGFHLENQEVSSVKNGAEDENGHKAGAEAECKFMQAFNEDEWPHKNSDSKNALTRHNENTAMVPEINFSPKKPQPRGEKLDDKDEIQEVNTTGIETNVTGDRVFQTEKDCCEIMQERQKPREEIPPSTVTKEEPFPTTERTLETEVIYQSDTSRSLPNPKVEEISWTHSHSVHKEEVGCRMSLEELVLKEKETSAARQPETLDGMEEDISQRDKDERQRIGKLKIEAKKKGEWAGNAENPGGESKNALVKLKEQELSAEVESPPRVEYQKMSERTKNPIREDGVVTLGQAGEKKEMLLEGFRQELVRTFWQEVFDCQYSLQAPRTQAGEDCHREDGHLVRSVITRVEKCKEALPLDCTEGQPLDRRDVEANTNTSAHLTQSYPLSIGSARSSLIDQESTATKHRSVTLKETDTEEVNYREGCNKTLEEHAEDSIRYLEHVPAWQGLLYVLFHITRLLICVLLVAGFFLIFFFYDLKTFFVLYSFSMCCWVYKWRSNQFLRKERRKEIENVALKE